TVDNLHLVQFAPPQFPSGSSAATAASPEGCIPTPSDAVRTFALMANLYAQEASGDPAASASPERVVHRLRGSNESTTHTVALVEVTQPLGDVSPLGVPSIPSAGECHDYDYAGFIDISVPLLEEKDTADLDFVLDVNFRPLPGQPLDDDAQHVATPLVNYGL